MDPEFQHVFRESIRRRIADSERAREQLDTFLTQLHRRTMGNGGPVPTPPAPFLSRSEPDPLPPAQKLNPVHPDWARTVIQAASLDMDFLRETGEKATKIVQAAIQQPPAVGEEPPQGSS